MSLMLVVVVQGKEMISIDKDSGWHQREQNSGASHDVFGSQRRHPRAVSPDRALLPTGVEANRCCAGRILEFYRQVFSKPHLHRLIQHLDVLACWSIYCIIITPSVL